MWQVGQWWAGWNEVLKRDPCAYCYGPSENLEHPVARMGRRAGQYRAAVIVGACRVCNQDKGSMPLLWYLLLRERRARSQDFSGMPAKLALRRARQWKTFWHQRKVPPMEGVRLDEGPAR